jgi:hypothetical protein
MDNEIKITLTTTQFSGLTTLLKKVQSNIGYFPRKALKTDSTKKGTSVTLNLNLEKYTNFKNALASIDSAADVYLDIFFGQGEETAQRIVDEMNRERQANMLTSTAAQTGLKDLQEVKVENIKPKIKVKAGSRKA